MPPLPTPTSEDITSVRAVTGELSKTLIQSLVDSLDDADWAYALELVDAWNEIEPGGLMALEGGREGVKLRDQDDLDDIRKRMRLLLGLPELRDSSITGQFGSVGIPVQAF